MKSKEEVSRLCQKTQIGNFKVKSFQPISHALVQGVIYQMGTVATMKEIIDCVESTTGAIVKAERIMKRRNWVTIPTTAVKLGFQNRERGQRQYC